MTAEKDVVEDVEMKEEKVSFCCVFLMFLKGPYL